VRLILTLGGHGVVLCAFGLAALACSAACSGRASRLGRRISSVEGGGRLTRRSPRSSRPRAILLEQNDEWAVPRARYMTLGTMAALSDDPAVGLPAMVI
jgi:hypothetical protein